VESSAEDFEICGWYFFLAAPCGKKTFKQVIDKLIIHIDIWKTAAINIQTQKVFKCLGKTKEK